MTVNFVGLEELEESMVNLSRVSSIKDLYLTGNPCTEYLFKNNFKVGNNIVISLLQLFHNFNNLTGKQFQKVKEFKLSKSMMIYLLIYIIQ